MTHLRVHVHDMDCAEEAALVRRALASNKAIAGVEFDLIHGFVDITFDERATDENALVRSVRSTGLGAHAVHGEAGHLAVAAEHAAHEHQHPQGTTRSTVISGVLFLAGWIIEGVRAEHWLDIFVHAEDAGHDERAVVAYALSALAGLWPMWPRAIAAIRHLRLDMHALVCLTVIGAAAIGEWSEGAAVAFLFALAHRMEEWSIERARAEIAALVGRGPALIAEGLQQSAPMERWIERFAAVYTPVVTGLAVVVAVVPAAIDGQWATWFYRGLFFLVLACPCALVISTPVTIVAALTSAARRGVLVKGGAVLERAATVTEPTSQGLAAVGITVAGPQAQRERLAAADVVLTASDERVITSLVGHARRAVRVVRQNVAISLATKVAFLVSAPFGFAPLWMAVLADTGATVIVTLNGLRLLRPPRY
ncbi:MAG TPA: heavy metal translocating P-type ATPase [Vicinamibacterales bacterium]|nr:heavy metal translocating P-type ATPase [Vicinamibacterales bacterium]